MKIPKRKRVFWSAWLPAASQQAQDRFSPPSRRDLHGVLVTQTGCIGICQFEPIVEVIDENGTKTTYVKMTPEKALRVVNDHIVNGNVVTEYTIGANQK